MSFCHVADLLLVAGDLLSQTVNLSVFYLHPEVVDLKRERMVWAELENSPLANLLVIRKLANLIL